MCELVKGTLVTSLSFHFSTRSPDVRHAHPILVFDTCDHLHVPLTVFAKEAIRVAGQADLQSRRSMDP